jgi:TP901 family phage tail tape measure protein
MNLGALIATLGVDTRGLSSAQRKMMAFERDVQKRTARINAQLTTIGKGFQNVGRSMTRYVTLPLLAAGAGAFKLQMDFESSMTKIVGLVGVAREQVDQWGEDVLKLAPKLGKGPKELADALFFVTSAGIRGAKAMDVLRMSAKASAAGLGETKTVADLVTSAMNAYGSEVLNAEKATDILVATVREGKAEASELASSMGMVLPIASNLGVSFDQVGAAVASMTRTGTNAATASMQLRQILASLLKPTSQAEGALGEMGTSASELRKTLREDGLIAVLGQLKTMTEGNEDAMANVFPNIRALSGVLDIVGANAADNVKIFGAMTDTTNSLNTAFGEASKTAKFQFDQALSSAKTTLTAFGETITQSMAPILKGLSERLKNLTEWFQGLSTSQQQNVIKMAALAAAMGPVLMITGGLLKGLGGLIKVGVSLIGVFSKLTLFLMANPWMLAVAGVAALTIAIVRLVKEQREATELQKAMTETTKAAIDQTRKRAHIIEQLYRIAQDENKTTKEREKALRQLKGIDEEYTKNLTLKNITEKEGLQIKRDMIKELIRQAKVTAMQDRLVDMYKQLDAIKEQAQAHKELSGWQKVVTATTQALTGSQNAQTVATLYQAKNLKTAKEEMTETEAAIAGLEKATGNLVQVGDLSSVLDPDPDGTNKTKIKKIKGATTEFTTALEILAAKNKLLGDSFDITGGKASLYEHQMDTLLSIAEGEVTPAIEALAEAHQNAAHWTNIHALAISKLGGVQTDQLANMDHVVKKNNEMTESMTEGGSAINNIMYTIGQTVADTSSAFSALGHAIAQAAEDSKVSFAEAANIIQQAAMSTISILAALAAAEIITAEASKGIVGIFTALAGLAMLAGVWAAFVKPKPMAEGGIVPPGYSNDTYPAMLSSGEEVRPPLPAGRGGGGATQVTVSPQVTAGGDILWLVEEAKRKQGNTSI